MAEDTAEKAKSTGNLYFKDVPGEKPFELWRDFDKELGKAFSQLVGNGETTTEESPGGEQEETT